MAKRTGTRERSMMARISLRERRIRFSAVAPKMPVTSTTRMTEFYSVEPEGIASSPPPLASTLG